MALGAMIVLGAAGCATYAWQKPGVTATEMERDARECGEIAARIASDYRLWTWPDPRWAGGLSGSPVWTRDQYFWSPGYFEVEQQAAMRCMEARGYHLVKTPKN